MTFARLSLGAFWAATLFTGALSVALAQDATKPNPDNFGEEVALPERTLLMHRNKTSWDEAWPSIVAAFKTVRQDAEKLNVKVSGQPLIIYRSTADDSFEFDAALPIEAAPANPPPVGGDVTVGAARTGKAIKFVYKGPFDAMDSTYELISNFIDSKKIDAEDLSIEEYVTDPVSTKPDEIVINIFMPLKKQ
jgi:effector-binding domain-containing protein